ncbi:MAG: diguanylate cyclase, partial [Selenomonadaceae bacterium]|nr:diguanylate cyclase [Selenomonadaceae bacterium]
ELSIDLETDLRNSENAALADAVTHMVSGGRGIADIKIGGENYYLAFAPIKHTGWSFAAAIARDDALAPVARNNELIRQLTEDNIHLLDNHMLSTMAAASILVLGLLGAVFLVGKKVSDRFVAPIHVLSDGVREIASGNLDKKIHLDTGDEIEHLASCFNDMTDSLKTYTENLAHAKAEQERQNDLLRKKNEELSSALHDVKRLRIARDNYRTKSEIDDLTHLYNKATMEQICEKRCRDLPEGKQAALYIIDLDHFKEANDTFGHQFGDQILAEFAFQLKHLCRAEDFAGRFGGDEFVLMIEGDLTEDIIKKKAQAIWQAAREIHVNGEPTAITASIGIALAPLHGTDYPSLFKTADNALYHVKKHGRDGFRIGKP